ncbi:hypothetical protein ACS0TY_019254 [Phlomoides rotata]
MKLSSILVFIVYFVRITVIRVGEGVSLSKPGCPETCGNVTVPYPFGMGSKCSANKSFIVTCNHTTNPAKPYLKFPNNVKLEALDFSLPKKTARVKQGVFPLLCNSTNTVILVGQILGAPFRYSPLYNTLVVIGCKNKVWLLDYGDNPSFGGCAPICGGNMPCKGSNCCSGMNCCRTTIPSHFSEPEVFYSSEPSRTQTVCGYAFMSDYAWLARDYVNFIGNSSKFPNPVNMGLGEVPLILDWDFEIPIENLKSPVSCRSESVSYSPSLDDGVGGGDSINVSSCYCEAGFEGNPYLPQDGCQDINECNINNTAANTCVVVGDTCVNTVGSFICTRDDENNRMKSTIVGLSSATGALVLLGGVLVFSRAIRKRIKVNRRKAWFKRNGGLLLQQQLSSRDGGVENIRLFDAKELEIATDRYNENRILGQGGQGTVYKGMLLDGRIVAVKKSKEVDEAEIEVFINEVVIMSQINHRNIVKLLGCCLETEVPLLVYEFVPNGTLFQHIHEQNDEVFPLSWKMRLRIATEIAEALSYLHYAASVPIYHRDIKSTNILLDEKYRAKVSDFGTSRSIVIDQTHLTTKVLGTFGYLDPEYFQTGHFTEKSDVYSFGVVMVELLTGEKAISAVREEAGRSLATHFLNAMEENNLCNILDPDVVKEGGTKDITAVARLAMRCLNLNGKKRPTIKDVATELVGVQPSKIGSTLQYDEEHSEFHSIEVYEDYDFPSTSDSTNSKGLTALSLAKSPLLLGHS